MDSTVNYSFDLYNMLKSLITLKSERDGKKFTTYQLAKAIDMPHSILVKLLHPDPNKRVNNPRVETLAKIIEFFKLDGFAITVDEFLFGRKEIDIQSQFINYECTEKVVQTYSLNNEQNALGIINIMLPEAHKNLVAFLAAEDIKPFFKAGSLFIVDKDLKPENESLIAIKIKTHSEILIKKLLVCEDKMFLASLDNKEHMPLAPTLSFLIIGVVIQVNAKT